MCYYLSNSSLPATVLCGAGCQPAADCQSARRAKLACARDELAPGSPEYPARFGCGCAAMRGRLASLRPTVNRPASALVSASEGGLRVPSGRRRRLPACPTIAPRARTRCTAPGLAVHNGKVKSFRRELWFEVPGRRAFLNITREVEDCLRESGVKEGLVLVNAMHITASVFINDDESGLHADYDKWLERLAPHEPTSQYRHNRTGEDNADAHMKRQVMGREVVVAVTGGKLDFGPWEQIFYGEFDGGRRKRALIKIIGE